MYDKLAIGLLGLCTNIGSRYIFLDVPKSIDLYMTKYFYLRAFILLLVIFSITRDFWISIILALLFIILAKYILNEESEFFVLDRREIQSIKEDFESKKNVSQEEYENAKRVLERFQSQHRRR